MDLRRFVSRCHCVPASMAAFCLACPVRRQGLARRELFCGTVPGLGCARFTLISPRSRSAHSAHGSTFVAHDASASLDLAWYTLETGGATPSAKTRGTDRSVESLSWLDWSDCHFSFVAHTWGAYARIAIA